MTLSACTDNRMGLQFNGRRQSQDRILRDRLISMVDTKLYISPYSAKMFEANEKLIVSEDFLSLADADDWIFVEDLAYLPYSDQIDRIVLFRWNRDYPSDLMFEFPGQWQLICQEDFIGSSHDNITMEIYRR